MIDENAIRITKFFRISPAALEEDSNDEESLITGPVDFVTVLKPRYGVVVASWDQSNLFGVVTRLGVILRVGPKGAVVQWVPADLHYRPNSSGRRFWTQATPFFGFAPAVAQRYMLASTFAEHFQDLSISASRTSLYGIAQPRPLDSPTGGYVYLVRSPYGVKIGKSVNVKKRARLFEVKLPFPIMVEHYAWFDDYSLAERDLHRQYHAKRLEGEWFDLSSADVEMIKSLGKPVSVKNL